MNQTLETIRVFFLMGAAGLVIGCLFDVFRAFHVSFKGAGEKFDFVSVQITDVIFAISSFCIFTLASIFLTGERSAATASLEPPQDSRRTFSFWPRL